MNFTVIDNILFNVLLFFNFKSTISIMEKCIKCNKRKFSKQVLQICNVCYNALHNQNINIVVSNFIKSTHVNDKDAHMYYVPYDQFKEIKYVTSGGFSKIYKGIWIDANISNWQKYNCCANMTVVLKELNGSKNMTYKELNEVIFFI